MSKIGCAVYNVITLFQPVNMKLSLCLIAIKFLVHNLNSL